MKTDNPIKLAIEAALKGAQFQRKSSTWYRDMEEAVVIVDVQKSNFGEQYYVNLGILVKELGQIRDKLPPKENECHIRLRLESLTHEEEQYVQEVVLRLDNTSLGPKERQQRVHDLIAEVALPFLLQCGTRAGIREAERRGQLRDALVHKAVREAVLL